MTLRDELKHMIVVEMNVEGVTPEEIDAYAPLFGEGLGLDSLDAIELVVLVKMRFGVEIRSVEEGREAFRSINALAEFIMDRAAG